jgi:hypothetical protein
MCRINSACAIPSLTWEVSLHILSPERVQRMPLGVILKDGEITHAREMLLKLGTLDFGKILRCASPFRSRVERRQGKD